MQLTIEKLIYGGDGLARGPAGPGGAGKAVFVPFVLAGERVEAAVAEEKPGFLRARAESILSPSPERTEPRCPYFASCGGCHYQHAGYDHQLQIKSEILRETLRRLAKIEIGDICVHGSPPWQYRNRTRMKVRASSQRDLTRADFALGYHRFSSHELLPVEQCPISSSLINSAIAALWELGRDGMVAESVREIEFFANAEDTHLLIELTLAEDYRTSRRKPEIADFVAAFRRALPEIRGVAAFRSTSPDVLVRETVSQKLKDVFGEDELVYRTHCCEFHVSAGSFFQTNRYLTNTLIELVAEGRSGDSALDLYAGAGLFTLPLSQSFRQVEAVEVAPFSFHDLRRNTPSNVAAHRQTTEEFLANMEPERRHDLIVVDPPRAGLGERVAKLLGSLPAERLTYVSCDPSTLARDLKVLAAAGFRIEEMHMLDLFPQTFHIESMTQLMR